MALMGLLHCIVLNDVSPQLAELFSTASYWPSDIASARFQLRRRNRQLRQLAIGTGTLRRSLFGLVQVYNLLPQHIVDHNSAQSLQCA